MKKTYPQDLQKLKNGGKKFATITAYDYTSAKIVNDIGFPVVLVGDSASMVVYGYKDTTPVSMDEMMFVLRSVIRGNSSSLIVADMPFMSYQPSTDGANAVKIEGGSAQSKTINRLVSSGVPVMGHIGLLPQSINATSGYRVQGKDEFSANEIIQDALDVERAGAFSIVLEGIPGNLAKIISSKIKIPTIGIGSGPHCDGQIQVFHDLLGIDKTFNPKHAKKFINSYELFFDALKSYKNDVECLKFPTIEHYINLSKDVEDKITENN
jgi:3-methyl-2-oxobutanoate hydroxymethyltransferase